MENAFGKNNNMVRKQKILRTLNKEIPQTYAVLIILLCGIIVGIFLIYQYWKTFQIFK